MKQFGITLTYKCNWNCPYCAVRNSVDFKQSVSHSDVLNKIQQVENNSNVIVFGGEPGVLPKDNLQTYIDILKDKNCTLELETNGLFLKRYPDLIQNFNWIRFHCSEDLYPELIPRYSFQNMDYMLIVHDDNITRLGVFLEMNSHIDTFYIVEATYPHETTGPILSNQNKNMLMTRFYKHMSRKSIVRLVDGYDFDNIIFLT